MGLSNTSDVGRYDRIAILMHWLIGVLLLGQMAFGFLLDDIAPRGTPARGLVINLHKSFGIGLALLILVRLGWRLARRPPHWAEEVPAWQRRAATVVHAALYACMLGLPLSGYVASNFSRHGVRFFGVPLPPWGPDLPAVYAFFNGVHIGLAWLFALLVACHVLAALKHLVIDRDGVFDRMLWRRRGSGHATRPLAASRRRTVRSARARRP